MNDRWQYVRLPLNKGSRHNIPRDALFHESVFWRLKNDNNYRPRNNHGRCVLPCLKHNDNIATAICTHPHCDMTHETEYHLHDEDEDNLMDECTRDVPHWYKEHYEHKTFKIERAASNPTQRMGRSTSQSEGTMRPVDLANVSALDAVPRYYLA